MKLAANRIFCHLFISLLLTLGVQSAHSQISLPFQTGFNTVAEQEQWTLYRLGDTSLSFNKWAFSFGVDPSLSHGYPVGGVEITDDWIVSDEIDLSTGGLIDSIRFKGSGFGLPFGDDTIALYAIEGHQHPDSATSQTLVKLFTDSTYVNDNVWKVIRGISIPEISGPAYLAFRYQTIVNWLDVNIDDLFVSSGISGLSENKNITALTIHPNPTQDKLYFDSSEAIDELLILDAQGRTTLSIVHPNNFIDVSSLESGVYFIQVESDAGLSVNRFVKH